MEARIVGYLEEYARALRVEFDSLMDRALNDRDEQAGKDALELVGKIKDIRGNIRRLVVHRTRHL